MVKMEKIHRGFQWDKEIFSESKNVHIIILLQKKNKNEENGNCYGTMVAHFKQLVIILNNLLNCLKELMQIAVKFS